MTARETGTVKKPETKISALPELDAPQAGTRYVLGAMAAFPDSEKLVRCGCLVLHNLSLDDGNVPHLLAAGVSLPLQRAARHHKDADVQRSAVSTLRRLGIVLHLRRDGDDDAAELVAADAAG